MKIVITGFPVAMPETVAKALAERLGLEFVTTSKNLSAEDVINMYETKDDIVLLTRYACLFRDCISVCLYDSLASNPTFPKDFHTKYKENIKFGRDVLGVDDLYDSSLYAITINRAALAGERVADIIISLMQKGVVGDFVSPYSVLPVNPSVSCTTTDTLENTVLVAKRLGSLYMYAECTDAAKLVDRYGVIPVKYVSDRIPELKKTSEYSEWFSYLGNKCTQLKLQHALALFCVDNDYKSHAETLIKFTENGDPWNKLQGLGYL